MPLFSSRNVTETTRNAAFRVVFMAFRPRKVPFRVEMRHFLTENGVPDSDVTIVVARFWATQKRSGIRHKNAYAAGMPPELPLDQMTLPEKLHLMEALWDDLTRKPGDIPSPDWHGEVLAECDRHVESGKEAFVDWDAAKAEIRRRVG